MNRNDFELNIKTNINTPKTNEKGQHIITFLETFEKIIRRLLQDVYTYADNLHKILEYYQNHDNDMIFEMIVKRFHVISELFYKSVKNHLSISSDEYGITEKIIKDTNECRGKTTTLKYYGTKKSYGTIQIQNTINVATLDNISIESIYDDNDVIGYNIMIGELAYVININLKNDDENIINIVNNVLNILEDIEISFTTNIEYIKKCVSVFETNIK